MHVDLDNEIRLRKERVLTLQTEIKQLKETRSILMGGETTEPVEESENPEKGSDDE